MKTLAHLRAAVAVVILFGASLATPLLHAQDPNELMPAASAAKAKGILDQAVSALGGSAYVNAHDLDCKGRLGQFDSATGAVGESTDARFMRVYPDKSRTELDLKIPLTDIYYFPINSKGRVVMVYTSDGAWALSKMGVSDMGTKAVSDYKDQLETDMNNVLRSRLGEDGMVFRYGGSDVVDLNEVDWVELTDKQNRVLRIAVDKKTHLPARSSLITHDPDTNKRIDTTRTFSNYHPVDGIEIPFQTSTFINDRPSAQSFYTECRADVGLSPALFTEQGLDAESAKFSKKSK